MTAKPILAILLLTALAVGSAHAAPKTPAEKIRVLVKKVYNELPGVPTGILCDETFNIPLRTPTTDGCTDYDAIPIPINFTTTMIIVTKPHPVYGSRRTLDVRVSNDYLSDLNCSGLVWDVTATMKSPLGWSCKISTSQTYQEITYEIYVFNSL